MTRSVCLLGTVVPVGAEVQLAVQAFAPVEEGHAVHVKVVAAARARGEGCNEGEDKGDDEPDAEDAEGDVDRIADPQGEEHRRQIDGDRPPQVPTAAADAATAIRGK